MRVVIAVYKVEPTGLYPCYTAHINVTRRAVCVVPCTPGYDGYVCMRCSCTVVRVNNEESSYSNIKIKGDRGRTTTALTAGPSVFC